ncbi:hypothetical protein [Aneurinibacillus migulanus]|uniref:hypothetical protein n=1 Tax=Aneurinibacillus migulanus TaxID=47500 RepID=UPI001F22741C|nr:hypothetical protein [Aneurinibacillus migulanus]
MINRQILVVKGKKRMKKSEIGKRHTGLSSAGAQGVSTLSFSPSLLLPSTLPCQNIKCNLYRGVVMKGIFLYNF